MSRAMAVHVRYKSFYISLPSSAEQLVATLRIYNGDGEHDAFQKICFYFTFEFRIYIQCVCQH